MTSASDDLLKRLESGAWPCVENMQEAAARIRGLEAELAELKPQRDFMGMTVKVNAAVPDNAALIVGPRTDGKGWEIKAVVMLDGGDNASEGENSDELPINDKTAADQHVEGQGRYD
jgi:hypothetical protein